MQILFISENFPWPLEDGGNLRTYHVLEAISRHHEVTLLSHEPKNGDPQAVKELQKFCRVQTVTAPKKAETTARIMLRPWLWKKSLFVLKNWSHPLFRASRQLLEQRSFDVVHFNHLDTAAFLTQSVWPKSVFDSHNCISTMAEQMAGKQTTAVWKRLIYERESRKLAQTEKMVCERSNVVFACSAEDRDSFLSMAAQANVHVVPNGVDTTQYEPNPGHQQVSDKIARIVFTGAMDYAPNVTGVDWFCENVLPIVRQHKPIVRFQVVGRNPTERVQQWHDLKSPVFNDGRPPYSNTDHVGVEVTGRVESVLPYLHGAAVVVVPLLDGGGTRLKILEAFAAQRAVVSTAKGAEGIEATHEEDILIADKPEAFASAILRLLNDPAEATRIGNAGRRLACSRYDWQTIGDQILQIYESNTSAV